MHCLVQVLWYLRTQEAFLLMSRITQRKFLLPLFNINYEVLATAIREEKELKYLKIKKKRQKCSLFYD